MSVAAGILGLCALLLAAAAVFLAGPPLLVRAARASAIGGLVAALVNVGLELYESGFRIEPTRGAGQGSLFATAGLLLLTFGATRAAERRRAAKDRERWMAERR